MKKRLLLLSNSTNLGEAYLNWPLGHIRDFLGTDVKKLLFIPYAAVTIPYDEYLKSVANQLQTAGFQTESVDQLRITDSLLSQFDAIAVGGGNTFQLRSMLGKNKLMVAIRNAVENGMPYIGWSAGSNITSPSIKTTNDMPIVEPDSFDGLNLVPFQINPHYTEATIPNHGGESRNMRLQEFVTLNRDASVVGLPEGSLLRVENEKLYFIGKGNCKVFKFGKETETYKDGDDLSWLMAP